MPVQSGDTVRVHYTGTLSDGSLFDSSEGGAPLAFTVGAGDVITGFDRAVTGMEVGETRTVTIPPAEAYGDPDPEQTLEVPRSEMPEGDIEVGDTFVLGMEEGEVPVTVAEVTDEVVTLDANHPLAGEALTFAITLDGVEPRS